MSAKNQSRLLLSKMSLLKAIRIQQSSASIRKGVVAFQGYDQRCARTTFLGHWSHSNTPLHIIQGQIVGLILKTNFHLLLNTGLSNRTQFSWHGINRHTPYLWYPTNSRPITAMMHKQLGCLENPKSISLCEWKFINHNSANYVQTGDCNGLVDWWV